MEGDLVNREFLVEFFISIHSLRMEGDFHGFCPPVNTIISIHSLRMEGDRGVLVDFCVLVAFQSTPSAWRETYLCTMGFPQCSHFNPLPPHGGRLKRLFAKIDVNSFQSTPSAWRETRSASSWIALRRISIHSLRMEGDYMRLGDSFIDSAFQSTPSAWRETRKSVCS